MGAGREGTVLAVGVFRQQERAQRLVERLIEEEFPMDRISLLGRAGGPGDDVLGITYHGPGERMKVWGEHGAFWGALWGALAGATGLFVLPGLGALLAAGPIVEALAGAIAGAALAGGAMAGAAAVTHLASALRRIGLPETAIRTLEQAVDEGKTVVILHADPDQAPQLERRLQWAGAEPVLRLVPVF